MQFNGHMMGISISESCLARTETVNFSEMPSTTPATQPAAPCPKQILSKQSNSLNALCMFALQMALSWRWKLSQML